MTPWHRFWFPDDEAGSPRATRDAALWSPGALASLQHALWQQAAEATAQWWRFVSASWPSLPVQPPPGSVTPPAPIAPRPARTAARPQGARTPPKPARKTPAAAAKRPRRAPPRT